jgi:general secretion pathway protein A
MYESFYGFTHKPFQLNPDPSFYFGSRQHQRAMAFLEYGLHQNEGFIVITGEIGAGKTTLVRSLLRNLNSDEVVAANLVSTQLDADDTLKMVAAAFGVRIKDMDKAQVLLSLEAFLASVAHEGKRCLLIVDEAQNLTAKAVEELRMLSNFQLDTHALLQSFLVGQPEFRQMLESPDMQQLRQRVIAACHVGSMDQDETQGYVEHRLKCVGWKDSPQFDPDVFPAIFQASGGVPRRINSICDRLLLSGFLANKRSFSKDDVTEIAEEFKDETRAPKQATRKRRVSDKSDKNDKNDKAAHSKGSKAVDIDLSQDQYDLMLPDEPPFVTRSKPSSVEEQLMHIEQGLIRLETTMLRLERNNTATLSLFKSLLEWARSHESEREASQQ